MCYDKLVFNKMTAYDFSTCFKCIEMRGQWTVVNHFICQLDTLTLPATRRSFHICVCVCVFKRERRRLAVKRR